MFQKNLPFESMTLIEDCMGPKKAPHALELRDLKGYSLILACERGAAEGGLAEPVRALMCGAGHLWPARTASQDWVDPQSKPPEEDEP